MVKANIYDGKIFVENSTVSDSVKFDTVKFTFPDSWNGYAKTAVFKSEDGQIINLVLDGANPLCINENECYIPHEVIKSPCFYLSVFGVSGDSVATTTQVSVPVLQSGYAEGNEPNEPTPTEYQQLIDLASYTKVIAQSVRDDADKGLFKGEKGDKGDTGKQGVQGEKGDKGEQGIQGPQGIQGKKGERGEQGIQGEKGDKGEQGIQGPQGIQGEKGERGEQGIQGEKGDKGDVNTEYLHNNFANALKVSKSGSAIVIDDTSPVEHELGVTIERKNLFNMHYVTNRTTTQHCNGNGGWYEDVVAYRGKTITYQVQVDFTNTLESAAGFRVKVWWYDANKKNLSVDTANAISNNGGLAISTLTTTVPNNATYAVFGVEASFSMWTDISAREGSSISYTNGMVELGSTATAYTPYISDFSTVNVSRYGKNLWNNGTVKLIE
ncbi:MAG: collagen-like protein, partial [Clostridia bacterium]|nr:collagen-like protein [Clostridia bacterium]